MPGVWRHTGVVRYGRHPDKEEVQSGTTWNSKYAYMNQPSAIGSTVARFDLGANFTLDSTDPYYFYHYDEAGNVILITDKNGNVVDHFEQDAWGNDLNSTFNTARSIAQHQTSKFYDTTTGLYFFGARWYYPEIGRFISVSPLAPTGEEEYVYSHSNPINFIDNNGLISFDNLIPGHSIVSRYWDQYSAVGKDLLIRPNKSNSSNVLKNLILDSANGIMSWTDGFIPLSDPFYQNGLYNWSDPGLNICYGIGTGTFNLSVLAIPFNPFNIGKNALITHWGPKGMTALRSGDWVMLGGHNVKNYMMSGIPGYYKYGNYITIVVKNSSLKWPPGIEFLKGLIGQRIYKP